MFILLIAGYETTHTLIGQSMRLMLENDQVGSLTDIALRGGKSGKLVKEYLRITTPVMNMLAPPRVMSRCLERRSARAI